MTDGGKYHADYEIIWIVIASDRRERGNLDALAEIASSPMLLAMTTKRKKELGIPSWESNRIRNNNKLASSVLRRRPEPFALCHPEHIHFVQCKLREGSQSSG